MEDLNLLRAELQEGIALSMQGSYARRLPAAAALPKIRSALKGLRALVIQSPSVEAWRALALAEEALLHYPKAVAALESAISLSQQADRKDLKRLVQLREYAEKWMALGLNPSSLEALGTHLENSLATGSCDHSHRFTSAWLSNNGYKAQGKVLQALKASGGYCDCEVLLNVV